MGRYRAGAKQSLALTVAGAAQAQHTFGGGFPCFPFNFPYATWGANPRLFCIESTYSKLSLTCTPFWYDVGLRNTVSLRSGAL
jgi:hypothetical protein